MQRAVGDILHKNTEYQRWADRVDQLVPRYSILNKDLPVEYRESDPGPEFDIANLKRMSLPAIQAYNDQMYATNLDRLRMNVMHIDAYRDDFTRGQRFELRIGRTSRVYYAVDDDYMKLHAITEDDDALMWMSSEIAQGMINHVKQGK